MQAKETTLRKLIEGQRQFQIPLYQRTYSWQERELRRLWTNGGYRVAVRQTRGW